MIVTLQSLMGYGLAQGAEIFNAGFSGYFVPVKMTAESLLTAARTWACD